MAKAKNTRELTISDKELEVMANLTGYQGEALGVFDMLKAVPLEKRNRAMMAYTQGIKFLVQNQGEFDSQAVVLATMQGTLTEGVGMLALTDVVNKKEEGHPTARFVQYLFALIK